MWVKYFRRNGNYVQPSINLIFALTRDKVTFRKRGRKTVKALSESLPTDKELNFAANI